MKYRAVCCLKRNNTIPGQSAKKPATINDDYGLSLAIRSFLSYPIGMTQAMFAC